VVVALVRRLPEGRDWVGILPSDLANCPATLRILVVRNGLAAGMQAWAEDADRLMTGKSTRIPFPILTGES